MKNVLYILIGWLLGLVSPWVAEIFRRPYRRSQVKRGMFIELGDLRAKLASLVLSIEMNRGQVAGHSYNNETAYHVSCNQHTSPFPRARRRRESSILGRQNSNGCGPASINE